MADDDIETLRIALVVALIFLGLVLVAMIRHEPAPFHLCPQDYFDQYGRCP